MERGVTKPADPKKDGYVFGGWNPQLFEKFPAENVIYTAQWQINTYKLTFEANGSGTLIATLDVSLRQAQGVAIMMLIHG